MVALAEQIPEPVELRLPSAGNLALLIHVLDLLPNPVYVKDSEHRWVEANKAFCELLGRPRDVLLGLSDYDFNPPEQADIFWEMDDKVFATQGSNTNYEETMTATGESLWVESKKSYFKADDGSEYLVGVLTDLTEMKAREAALAIAEKEALAGARSKSEFLANMSHEIRTPMNGVLGMTQILRGTELTAAQAEMVDTLDRSGNALLSLIDDILDFSKIEAGQLQLSPEPFILREMIDDVAILLGATARDKGLDLIVKFSPDLPQAVIGDAGRLRQIMMNLIGNAVKFTDEGYVAVDVTGMVEGDVLQLKTCIRDTGIGIAQEKLSTIFEKFQQADNSTTRVYGGTGLGLSIARDLATLMEGELVATSTLGEGSSFCLCVSMPISDDIAPQVSVPTISTPKLKTLVVDDIALNLDIVDAQLDRLGQTADRAMTAKEAVAKLIAAVKAGAPYDLLITDYQMPDINGLELATSLRQQPHFANLQIMVMSSVNDVDVRHHFREANVNDYLVKPIGQADFDSALTEIAQRFGAPSSI